MKNNLLKYYIAAAYLCSTFVLFAQPGSGSSGGDLEDNGATDTTPAAPIDNYIWVLAFIAIVFVFLKFRDIQNKKLRS